MRTPRVVADLPWADRLVDLRADASVPLPQTAPEPAHTVRTGGVTFAGSFDWDTNTASLWWADQTGFRGAVVGPSHNETDEEMSEAKAQGRVSPRRMGDVFTSVGHLFTTRRVTIRKTGPQEVFAARLGTLSSLVKDTDRLLAPIAGVRDTEDHVGYRLAWAAHGVEVGFVPSVLRNPTLLEDHDPPPWGTPPQRVLPYGLAYRHPSVLDWRGVAVAAHWLDAGFGLNDVEHWVQVVTGYTRPGTRVAGSSLPGSNRWLGSVYEFARLGFTPVEAAAWLLATTPEQGDGPRLEAHHIDRYRRAGVPRQVLTCLTSVCPSDVVETTDLLVHFDLWLIVAEPVKVGWYAAAGFTRDEAAALEATPEPPTVASLQMLAGLSEDRDNLLTTLHGLP